MARSRPEIDVSRRKHMAQVIRQARLEARLEQAELAEQLGVTAAAVGNWERCISRPDPDLIPRLCELLRISVTDLLGMAPELSLNGDERHMISAYRQLTGKQKKMVLSLAEETAQNNLIVAMQQKRRTAVRKNRLELGAAAGFGGPMEDEVALLPTYIRSNPLSDRSTLIVPVNGESMEPVYPDGSYVYVDEKSRPRLGDDVIVIYEGTCYIKRFEREGLLSYNPDKSRFPLIRVDGWQNVRYIGRVIGKVNDYDFFTGSELAEIEEAFSPEYD